MIILKQSTASQEIPLGYFLDSTDGNTEETALSIANTDIKLWKTGATTLANKNSGGATHISNGIYYAVLDATDTDTLGPMVIFVHVSGALSIRLECLVVTAAAYDVLTAATGDAYARLGAPAGASVSADIAAVKADTAAILDDTGTSGVVVSAASVRSAVGLAAANLDTQLDALPTAAENADAVWDEARAGHVAAGSFGEGVASVQGNVTGSVASVTAGVTVANGGIASTSFAAGAIDSAAIAADAITSSELAQSAAQEIADEVLNRDIAGGASGGTRNVRNALRSLRNRAAIAAGTLTVYQEDDTTAAWTAAVTTTAGDPVSEVDPT